jgi:hypothetical protein
MDFEQVKCQKPDLINFPLTTWYSLIQIQKGIKDGRNHIMIVIRLILNKEPRQPCQFSLKICSGLFLSKACRVK